jgi:ABC-type Mn2+/Zn2+ transport system ATPase subunit
LSSNLSGIDTSPTNSSARNRAAPTVVLRDVEVVRGDRVALSVGCLDIGPGLTTLVGANGSGKTTLLHLLTGLIPARRGEVSVLGQRPAEARRSVAYVLQTHGSADHLPVTAREVVALGRAPSLGPVRRLRAADRDRVTDAMERMEVTDLAHRHLADMSGGQRQRVLIAQGLAQDADVLLLDEPVAGLDLASIDAIRREIEVERAAGRTVIVATHDLGEAARSDHVVLLAGRIVADGPPSDVLTPAHLHDAYAGRLIDLGGHALALDDGSHHEH